MSRSFKKTPICKDGYGSKKLQRMKRLANKKVRHAEGVPNNFEFKKYFEAWEIHDYKFYMTESELREDWEKEEKSPNEHGTFMHDRFKTYEKALHWFRKAYRNK